MESRPSKPSPSFVRAVLGVSILWCCVSACRGCVRTEESPNVILIVVDALRADHLTHAAYSRNTSPFLDRLAARGVVFETTISQSSWTKTSLPSLLSSLYPEAHGVRRVEDVLPDSVQLLPELLKNQGYRTFGIHGNPWMDERFGFNQGFDEFIFKHWYKDSLDARVLNKQALRWLDEGSNRPFFLFLHYMDVHSPWKPPEEFDVFGPEGVDQYDASILFVDSQIGALYEDLNKRGLADNTWVVITADHGEEFLEHGNERWGHGVTLYQEVLRVPLIFHHPTEAASGKRVEQQVRLIDVAPTILDLLRIPIPDDMDGISLAHDVVEAAAVERQDLMAFSQVGLNDAAPGKNLLAVTTPEHKYILDLVSGDEELYDLKLDPGETRNLSTSNQAIARRFREEVLQSRRIQMAKRSTIVEGVEIDDELREQLRSLGYLK